jgi:hypothetical protein
MEQRGRCSINNPFKRQLLAMLCTDLPKTARLSSRLTTVIEEKGIQRQDEREISGKNRAAHRRSLP